jgi:hypothetical protein
VTVVGKGMWRPNWETNIYTSVKDPVNRPSGDNIFIVPDEIHFLPNVTKKAIHVSLTQIISSIKPIRAKNSNLQMRGGTLLVGI